ncbi:MAG: transposase [Rhodocyclaceae bacterium]|nr:transposase [Rhodocyclaceae bacterium]
MRKLSVANPQQLRELIRAAGRTSAAQRQLHKLHALLLVGNGRSCYEVAQWFDESPRTIERWVRAFERQGADGLAERHAGGRSPCVSEQDVAALVLGLSAAPGAAAGSYPAWTGKRLQQQLQARFGVNLSARHCQRLLRRLAPQAGA